MLHVGKVYSGVKLLIFRFVSGVVVSTKATSSKGKKHVSVRMKSSVRPRKWGSYIFEGCTFVCFVHPVRSHPVIENLTLSASLPLYHLPVSEMSTYNDVTTAADVTSVLTKLTTDSEVCRGSQRTHRPNSVQESGLLFKNSTLFFFVLPLRVGEGGIAFLRRHCF